jgi:hypothetical protein
MIMRWEDDGLEVLGLCVAIIFAVAIALLLLLILLMP